MTAGCPRCGWYRINGICYPCLKAGRATYDAMARVFAAAITSIHVESAKDWTV